MIDSNDKLITDQETAETRLHLIDIIKCSYLLTGKSTDQQKPEKTGAKSGATFKMAAGRKPESFLVDE